MSRGSACSASGGCHTAGGPSPWGCARNAPHIRLPAPATPRRGFGGRATLGRGTAETMRRGDAVVGGGGGIFPRALVLGTMGTGGGSGDGAVCWVRWQLGAGASSPAAGPGLAVVPRLAHGHEGGKGHLPRGAEVCSQPGTVGFSHLAGDVSRADGPGGGSCRVPLAAQGTCLSFPFFGAGWHLLCPLLPGCQVGAMGCAGCCAGGTVGSQAGGQGPGDA